MDAKKDKLFTEGNIAKWELPSELLKKYPKEQLAKDKVLVWESMLYKVR